MADASKILQPQLDPAATQAATLQSKPTTTICFISIFIIKFFAPIGIAARWCCPITHDRLRQTICMAKASRAFVSVTLEYFQFVIG
jgi:hypothetical protein